MENKIFNIRVYAIILDESEENILLSDELIKGLFVTKFPGGGLNWGEGTIDCLKREAMEEIGYEINVLEHFYTTDFFQPAFFYENQQLISIYYKAKFIKNPVFDFSEKEFIFPDNIEESESFRWFPLKKISSEVLTLPVDKRVADMLKNIYT